MNNISIIFMTCSLYFPSPLFILKNIPARWKSMRNTFFEEQLVGCSTIYDGKCPVTFVLSSQPAVGINIANHKSLALKKITIDFKSN